MKYIWHRRISTYLAYIICELIYPRPRIIPKKKIQKALLITLDYVGDFITATPVISAMKQHFRNASLWVMVGDWNKTLAHNHPEIDHVVIYNADWLSHKKKCKADLREKLNTLIHLKNEKFDLVVNLRGSFGILLFALMKPSIFWIDRGWYLAKLRLHYLKETLLGRSFYLKPTSPIDLYFDILEGLEMKRFFQRIIVIPEIEKHAIRRLLHNCGINLSRPIVSIFPTTSSPLRRWEAGKWAQVIDGLILKYETQIVISSERNDEDFCAKILSKTSPKVTNLTGRTTLLQSAALIELSDVIICLDSAPMHFAMTFNRPFVALFGPGSPAIWEPFSSNSRVIYKHLRCSDTCVQFDKNVCHLTCMKSILPRDVLSAVEELVLTHRIL